MDIPKISKEFTGINPLSMLHLQNKSYEPKVMIQAREIFELISRAILKDMNYIEYTESIYPVNLMILGMKGYFLKDGKIIWNDYCSY